MEKRVETAQSSSGGERPGLRVRMLGPLTISRDGVTVALPKSRKMRALLGYLALASQPVGRGRICELLWEVPNDPRGELRWTLSKLRTVLDEPFRPRVLTVEDTVSLDLSHCYVDVQEIARVGHLPGEISDIRQLRDLSALFAGDFLEGLDVGHSPHFDSWLTGQRRRFRAFHAAILDRLASCLPPDSDALITCIEELLRLAPFDRRPHEMLVRALALQGRLAECDEHLAATAKLFEAEGLDWTPMRDARHAAVRPAAAAASPLPPDDTAPASARASIAVMPFSERPTVEGDGSRSPGGLADALAHDVITRLARLRSLFVIARGTVFSLAERGIGPEEAARTLNVDYVASGSVHRRGEQITVTVDLVDARTARIVWAEVFARKADDALLVLNEIGDRIVASIAAEVETAEKHRAILKPPHVLNAWEAYHRGLWHMYRFTGTDNDQAQHFFQRAVQLDPTFTRGYAGLSFTHFQNAFLLRTRNRQGEMDRAYETAGQSLIVDDASPAAHWAMGRALWLRGSQSQAIGELETSVDLSPNFALGHYTLAFVQSQSGDAQAAIRSADLSRDLSPFDPLLFGIFGSRAMAHMRLGQYDEAAEWAVKAAARPNAHVHILAIAAHCLALAGRLDDAHGFVTRIQKILPDYGEHDFLTAFRFSSDAAAIFEKAAERLGLR